MAGLIYNRTISVSRPNADTGVGAQGYSGLQSAGETVLFSNIPASIQLTRRVGKPDPQLASDAYSIGGFNIFVPVDQLSIGDVTEDDVVTDDIGKRYIVVSAYWTAFGYNLMCVQLSK